MIEYAESMINISLADPNQRVLFATCNLIECLVKDFRKDQIKYITKFVPKLVTIIRSSSIYPSIQYRATTAIHLIIANSADEEAVKSFLEDLMPVLLDLLEDEDREFGKIAKKTLKLLAVSFPVIFLRYFQKAVTSLKAFTSQLLLEKKIMDNLSFIFMGPLMHKYFSLLKDIQPEALSQLGKLPQQVAGQFLSMTMPDLLQTLENAEPFTKFGFKSSLLIYLNFFLLNIVVVSFKGRGCPDNVKAVAMSIFNLLLSDHPQSLERYYDTYPMIVMDLCYSQSPQLQREAALGIGLRATHINLMPNFDAPVFLDGLNFVIDSGRQSEERAKAYDAAISAFGKILEFRLHIIHTPQMLPLRLSGNAQFNLPLERYGQELLGHNDKNLSKAIHICKKVNDDLRVKILSKGHSVGTSATIRLIKSWLSKIEAKP
ncbi:hypothetical protein K1719_029528 [Acacia pycnantha]|nr:hypothetical protein K1719_029528 [Acacia pycnantha]